MIVPSASPLTDGRKAATPCHGLFTPQKAKSVDRAPPTHFTRCAGSTAPVPGRGHPALPGKSPKTARPPAATTSRPSGLPEALTSPRPPPSPCSPAPTTSPRPLRLSSRPDVPRTASHARDVRETLRAPRDPDVPGPRAPASSRPSARAQLAFRSRWGRGRPFASKLPRSNASPCDAPRPMTLPFTTPQVTNGPEHARRERGG